MQLDKPFQHGQQFLDARIAEELPNAPLCTFGEHHCVMPNRLPQISACSRLEARRTGGTFKVALNRILEHGFAQGSRGILFETASLHHCEAAAGHQSGEEAGLELAELLALRRF